MGWPQPGPLGASDYLGLGVHEGQGIWQSCRERHLVLSSSKHETCDGRSCIGLHARQDVAERVQRDHDTGMTQSLADDLG